VSISTKPHTEWFNFARTAIERVKEKCPGLVMKGLLRVDIFRDCNGVFVVNEFESLDAGYGSLDGNDTCRTTAFLQNYWFNLIQIFCLDATLEIEVKASNKQNKIDV
jgi:hypothetical protein